MNLPLVLLATFGIGALSGLRAFTPIALVSWLAIWGWIPVAGSRLSLFGTTPFAIAASFVAIVELIGDKLPITPPRIRPGPLGARILMGGLAAATLCLAAGQSWLAGILVGAVGSVAGAFGGYHARRFLVQQSRIPDLVVAIAEDLVTIAGTLFLLRQFFGTAV